MRIAVETGASVWEEFGGDICEAARAETSEEADRAGRERCSEDTCASIVDKVSRWMVRKTDRSNDKLESRETSMHINAIRRLSMNRRL